MSYSFSTGAQTKALILDVMNDQGHDAILQMGEEFREPATETIAALGAALREVLPTLGREDDLVSVTVSGHANPAHAPYEGWADEFASLYVQVVVPSDTGAATPDVETEGASTADPSLNQPTGEVV